MSLEKCKTPNCDQLVEISCSKVIILMAQKLLFEKVISNLTLNSELLIETDKHLDSLNKQIASLEIKNEDYFLEAAKGNPNFQSIKTEVILTEKCLAGHENKYILNCS